VVSRILWGMDICPLSETLTVLTIIFLITTM
jgi:hypothetical protein